MAGTDDKGGKPAVKKYSTVEVDALFDKLRQELDTNLAERVAALPDLNALAAELEQRYTAFMEEVKALIASAPVVELSSTTAEIDEPLSPKEMALIDAACAAYGVPAEHLLAANVDRATGEAVLVTNGGAKVRFAKGQEVAKLSEIRITGINPNPKRRQITGAGAKK